MGVAMTTYTTIHTRRVMIRFLQLEKSVWQWQRNTWIIWNILLNQGHSDGNNFRWDHVIKKNRTTDAYNDVPRIMKNVISQTEMAFRCASSEGDVHLWDFIWMDMWICWRPWSSLGCWEIIRVAATPRMLSPSQEGSEMVVNELFTTSPVLTASSSNSPDCNPMDCCVWGAVEKDTNRTACPGLRRLRLFPATPWRRLVLDSRVGLRP